ncbi:MAG: GDSL-type esterase/lipase family protein [Verrucomicrobiae bacterium]|nr:GDSL-type esterase/lipase family protein [Verrucomicrobiae bacterium]
MKRMRQILHCALAAILLLASQTFGVCAETNAVHNFNKWEREIAAYEQKDATNPPPKGAIVFTGSSTIARWKTLAQDFPDQPVLNRGFGGSEVVDATHFAERLIFPYEPKMVFFRAGGNDLAAGKSVEQVFSDFQEFVEKVHARLPETKIAFISWGPTPSRWAQHEREKQFNALAAGYITGKPYLKYIETYDLPLGTNGLPRAELFVADKLHFNASGYKLLAERVRPFLPK